MNIHEHQAKDLLKNYGANVSNGVVILSEEEITKNFKIFLPEYCFKSKQIIEGVFSKHEITKCN